jgi:hypothetical protein
VSGKVLEDEMKNRKFMGLALGAMLLALSFPSEAQQPKKVPRIGYLSNTDPASESARSEAVRLAAMWMSSH